MGSRTRCGRASAGPARSRGRRPPSSAVRARRSRMSLQRRRASAAHLRAAPNASSPRARTQEALARSTSGPPRPTHRPRRSPLLARLPPRSTCRSTSECARSRCRRARRPPASRPRAPRTLADGRVVRARDGEDPVAEPARLAYWAVDRLRLGARGGASRRSAGARRDGRARARRAQGSAARSGRPGPMPERGRRGAGSDRRRSRARSCARGSPGRTGRPQSRRGRCPPRPNAARRPGRSWRRAQERTSRSPEEEDELAARRASREHRRVREEDVLEHATSGRVDHDHLRLARARPRQEGEEPVRAEPRQGAGAVVRARQADVAELAHRAGVDEPDRGVAAVLAIPDGERRPVRREGVAPRVEAETDLAAAQRLERPRIEPGERAGGSASRDTEHGCRLGRARRRRLLRGRRHRLRGDDERRHEGRDRKHGAKRLHLCTTPPAARGFRKRRL